MASVLDQSDEKFNNFVALVIALKLTTEGLEDFVNNSVKDLHKKISNKCMGYPACTDNCSKVHVTDLNKWCDTCKKWKKEIALYMRNRGRIKGVQWSNFESRHWSHRDQLAAINQVANVFVYKCRDPAISVTEELSSIISLFENCKYFSIERKILSDIREVRNKNFAHNSKFTVEENDLLNCLDVLSGLHNHRSLQAYKECKITYQKICDLKLKMKRDNSCEISEITPTLLSLVNVHHNKPDIVIQKAEEIISNKHSTYVWSPRQSHRRYDLILLYMCFFIYQMLPIQSWNSSEDLNGKDCKTMDFLFPWKSELTFRPYTTVSDDFVGREWMIEDLSYELINTERRGILVAAELGFGKSALVSHIACSHDKRSPAFPIFEKMTFIHFCRYDSNLTLHPGVFVRNMAGKLSNLYQEFGNVINTDSTASLYLSSSKCIEDPYGCFDYTVLNPLLNTSIGQNTLMIFIIDALDECIEIGEKNIFSLLNNKIYLLPPKIKFLLTSRNISSIRMNLPSGISVYHNSLFQKNNIEDIRKYIRRKMKNYALSEQYHQMLSSLDSDDVTQKLAELCGGNFLFLIHALEFWVKEGNVNNFPTNIENIYRINVIRLFGKNENLFRNVRSIFEILCASSGSVNESLLFDILDVKESQQRIYFSRLISNELSHFVQKSSGKIRFTNKRIADFFSRQDNVENDFYILQRNGHEMISRFWLRYIKIYPNITKPIMMIDIFKHVAYSKNQTLSNQLITAVRNHVNTTVRVFLKHYIAAVVNSYDAMLLAIKSTSETEIDNRDRFDSTASYIAAAYGNEKSLAALLKEGSDINFQRPQPVFSEIRPSQDPIYLSKYRFQWGYNLANIASQNGHENILKLLIKHGIDVCHKNSVGLNSFHLASEHGHTQILRILISTSTCNWNLSFQASLFLAAKNGHLSVVKYLLSLNVVDRCVPCSDTFNWIPKGKIRLQSNIPYQKMPEQFYKNFVLIDDRHLIFCESALDIAVQNRYLEIVKVLGNASVNALKCVNARGMTPLITAAAFESYDIVLYFLQSGMPLNDTCKVIKNMKTRFHPNNNKHFSLERFCVKGLSFWHMLAIYSSDETMEFVFKTNKFAYIWNITDEHGATPFHFACCNVRLKNIRFFYSLASQMQTKTTNGSTPAHSAALCSNLFPIYVFVKYCKLPVDIKDNSNRNILHYLAMSDWGHIYISRLLEIYGNSYENLLNKQDVDGRTPLHYAAMTGKIFWENNPLNLTTSFNPHHYMTKDKNNMTVLDTLFRSMPSFQPKFGKYILNLAHSCDKNNLFRTPGCPNVLFNSLDSFEIFAFKAFSTLKDTKLVKKKNIFNFMHQSLGKNRFYVLDMIKALFPKFYTLINKKHVHFMLAQLLKKSLHPNFILASTFFSDLVKLTCESKKQDGSLWYIFYDKERKFWPMYLTWNGTNLNSLLSSVLEKCNQRGMIDAVVKGGNIYVQSQLISTKSTFIDIANYLRAAPCIIAKAKYFIPKILYKTTKYHQSTQDVIPYSHPEIMNSYCLISDFPKMGLENDRNLSLEQIAAAKGFLTILLKHKTVTEREYFRSCRKKHDNITQMLAYFFEHDLHSERCIDLNKFYSSQFVSLFFKITMDFHTFVFPKKSAAWKCYRYMHKINRMSLQKLICRTNLENEICRLLTELYSMDWRLFYHIYTFKEIYKYVDHRWKYPFDFINFSQLIRIRCQARKTSHISYLSSQVEAFNQAQQTVIMLCSDKRVDSRNGTSCLRVLSLLNKQRKYISYQIQSILGMYFPLTYMIYHEFIIELPDLANKNTMQIVQIMHAYGSAPFFHNNPLFDYWNALDSSFSNPFRKMTRTILSSEVSEIISWIQRRNSWWETKPSIDKHAEEEILQTNPLSPYENLIFSERDSTEPDLF